MEGDGSGEGGRHVVGALRSPPWHNVSVWPVSPRHFILSPPPLACPDRFDQGVFKPSFMESDANNRMKHLQSTGTGLQRFSIRVDLPRALRR
jgi:hypothetical protein